MNFRLSDYRLRQMKSIDFSYSQTFNVVHGIVGYTYDEDVTLTTTIWVLATCSRIKISYSRSVMRGILRRSHLLKNSIWNIFRGIFSMHVLVTYTITYRQRLVHLQAISQTITWKHPIIFRQHLNSIYLLGPSHIFVLHMI